MTDLSASVIRALQSKCISVGEIENYYGGLWVAEHDGRFYWAIENFMPDWLWEEISPSLYNALLEHQKSMEEG